MRTFSRIIGAIVMFAATPTFAQDVFVTTTDFATGSFSTLNGAKTATNNVASVHSDATSRFFGGLIYVVNRAGGDNIQVLDPTAAYATLYQQSTGNGTNPHDIAVLTTTDAYVPRYDDAALLRMNPVSGATINTISFASIADPDGLPEMDTAFLFRNHLFVTVQRLDRNNFYSPTDASYLVVVDTDTDAFVDTDAVTGGVQHIELAITNPFSEIQLDYYTGNLYVSCVGFFGVLDGGVEMIDPETFQSQGLVITETEAGGDILDVEIVSDDKGYAIISTPSFVTELISFDPSTGLKTGTMYAPGAYVLQDIDRAPSGELFLTDRSALAPGIRCYDTATDSEITVAPIDVGLPPFDLTFALPTQTGTETPTATTALGDNYPNPFNPTTTLPFTLASAGNASLRIYDAHGQLLRTLADRMFTAGPHTLVWDGRDDRGSTVGTGVYFARLVSGDIAETRKLVLIK